MSEEERRIMRANARKRRRRRIDKHTFTKIMVTWLLILGMINGTIPFILSACGKDPVSEMGIAWVTQILGVSIGYMIKAYFETKQEKKQALDEFKAGMIEEDLYN